MKNGFLVAFCRPGSDLLSQVLRHSTIGAEAFNDRVRDGIGFGHPAIATRPAKGEKKLAQELKDRTEHCAPKWNPLRQSHNASCTEDARWRPLKKVRAESLLRSTLMGIGNENDQVS